MGVAGSVTLQAWKYYTIAVPSGATNLAITLTGLSADIDLYVNNSTTHPTTSTYYGALLEQRDHERVALLHEPHGGHVVHRAFTATRRATSPSRPR